MAYTHVDKPIRIGGVELRNRIVRPAHGTNHGRGLMSDQLIAYHAARARGGAALSIIEIGSVHPSTPFTLNLWDPALEPGFRKLVETIQPLGMKLFQQLWHAGNNTLPVDGSPPWAPSDTPGWETQAVPQPMTRMMIDEIVEAYARCAKRCQDWGMDGVDVHAAHGYLPAQFLSPLQNHREDDYGGSFDNRCRFLIEVLEAIRSEVSADFAVGVRLSPDHVVGGLGVEDNLRVANRLEDRHLIDYVNLSAGNYVTLHKTIGGMHDGTGYEMPESAVIARGVKVPTMVIGRYRTLDDADQVIRSGDADMVGMVRGMIADPDLVNKSLAGHENRVRPCIGCNQGCVNGIMQNFWMECTVNPAVGRETELGDDRLQQAQTPKTVLVVGGGPCGMEAARVAALRGHKVILTEASSKLGGMVPFSAKLPSRHGMSDITDWQEREIFRLGVDVRLSNYVEVDDIADIGADAVIVATGSLPRMDGVQTSHLGQPVAGVDRPNVCPSSEHSAQLAA